MIVKTQRGSADVMNEGFHEGLDSGQISELNKHEHYTPEIHEESTPAINHLAAPCKERFTQPPG